MQLARVIGPVVAPVAHPFLAGKTLLLVERLRPDGTRDANAHHRVAIDTVGAGEGDVVLVLEEGNSARQIFEDASAPVRSVIVGFVDEVEVGGTITLTNTNGGGTAERAR